MSGHLDFNSVFATHCLCASTPRPSKLKKDSMSWGGRRLIGEVREEDGPPSWYEDLSMVRPWAPGAAKEVGGAWTSLHHNIGVEMEVAWWAHPGRWA